VDDILDLLAIWVLLQVLFVWWLVHGARVRTPASEQHILTRAPKQEEHGSDPHVTEASAQDLTGGTLPAVPDRVGQGHQSQKPPGGPEGDLHLLDTPPPPERTASLTSPATAPSVTPTAWRAPTRAS